EPPPTPRCPTVRPPPPLHPTPRLLLDAIVADGRRRNERLPDLGVGGPLEVPRIGGMARPHAREAVGLELHAHRLRIRSGLREEAQLVLHVVPVLVGHDVTLGERAALRAEALRQILEEAE